MRIKQIVYICTVWLILQNVGWCQEDFKKPLKLRGPSRVINSSGWIIPGYEYLSSDFIIDSKEVLKIQGEEIVVTTLKSKGLFDYTKLSCLPILLLDDDNDAYCRLEKFWAEKITIYEKSKTIFCVKVKVTQYRHDTNSGHGGAGPSKSFAFFDEDGDGSFESMENSTVVLGDPNKWELHIPKWVK